MATLMERIRREDDQNLEGATGWELTASRRHIILPEEELKALAPDAIKRAKVSATVPERIFYKGSDVLTTVVFEQNPMQGNVFVDAMPPIIELFGEFLDDPNYDPSKVKIHVPRSRSDDREGIDDTVINIVGGMFKTRKHYLVAEYPYGITVDVFTKDNSRSYREIGLRLDKKGQSYRINSQIHVPYFKGDETETVLAVLEASLLDTLIRKYSKDMIKDRITTLQKEGVASKGKLSSNQREAMGLSGALAQGLTLCFAYIVQRDEESNSELGLRLADLDKVSVRLRHSKDYFEREAGAMAFAAVFEGPDKLIQRYSATISQMFNNE